MHSTAAARTRATWILIPSVLILLAAGASCTDDAASRFQLEPVNSSGVNPFMSSVGTDRAGVTTPAGAGGTTAGNTAGLYGGTLDRSSCDPRQLVNFLNANPDKAAAWAGVLGMSAADIPAYVATLTSVILRSDTAVINHGFENGHATSLQSVLQAGTAVLVDKFGAPVTKCFCGNPLTKPARFDKPTFTGTQWPSFSATLVTVVVSVNTTITQFTLVNPESGDAFNRPVGTEGGDDEPAAPSAPTTAASPSAAGTSTSTSAGTPTPNTPGSASTPPSANAPSSGGGGPGSTSAPTAAWAVTCVVDQGGSDAVFRAAVAVKNNDASDTHSYQATVTFTQDGTATASVQAVAAGATGQVEASSTEPGDSARALPAGPTSCEISEVVDEDGATVRRSGTVAAPAAPSFTERATPTTSSPTAGPQPS